MKACIFILLKKRHLKKNECNFFKTKRPFIFTIIIELIQNILHNENFYLQKILNKKTIKLWYKLLNKNKIIYVQIMKIFTNLKKGFSKRAKYPRFKKI